MQPTVQVAPASLELTQADAVLAAPMELSSEMLALVAGGSPRGGWLPTEDLVVIMSPRGGW